jgi:ketosteroid isomerase-like protein
MNKFLSLTVASLLAVGLSLCIFAGSSRADAAGDPPQASNASQIIAREKAAFEAWEKKDKGFWADYLSEDATYFGPMSPYLDTEMKVNFIPKFEKYAEMYKYNDYQMYNPRVQFYGDTAILTYNGSYNITANGQPISFTTKTTSVYVKQGNTWRVVHGHESMNPSGR